MALGTVPGADVATDLSVHDLGFPAKLSQVGALVTRDGMLVASLTASGETAVSAAVPATAGADYQIFGYATAAASTAGFYSVDIADGSGDSLLHVSQGVTDPASGIQAFVYPASVASAGSYTVDFTDFGFPAGLTGASLALAQNGALVGTAVAPGATLNASLAVDPLDVLVVATPATGGGLFGFDVLAGSGTALLRESQGVGAAFSATPVTVTAAGNYIVNVTDVGFPAPFSELAVVVTQGGQNIGSIIGGGQFTFSATPGSYILNFIATPNATADAGTFALSVVEAPPAPTVTLSASALEVSSGGTVTLTWMTQNATTCNASGGWSGTLATSGSQTSAKVTASTTYTLSCTGEGGTTTQSVTVALAPSSHGGGELDIETLFALLVALAWARHRIDPGQLRAWPRVTRRS
jgi:plastocyanin